MRPSSRVQFEGQSEQAMTSALEEQMLGQLEVLNRFKGETVREASMSGRESMDLVLSNGIRIVGIHATQIKLPTNVLPSGD